MTDIPPAFSPSESAELLGLAEQIGRIGVIDWQVEAGPYACRRARVRCTGLRNSMAVMRAGSQPFIAKIRSGCALRSKTPLRQNNANSSSIFASCGQTTASCGGFWRGASSFTTRPETRFGSSGSASTSPTRSAPPAIARLYGNAGRRRQGSNTPIGGRKQSPPEGGRAAAAVAEVGGDRPTHRRRGA